jgi:hypothetical protein
MKVGIVGCGVISKDYAENARAFDFELAACADIQHSYAEALAAEHGIGALAPNELMADSAIEVVLNLTPPPPLDFKNVAYTARIDGGTKQITELDLAKKGKYALLCFVSDRKGGPPHVAKGMITEVTVR